jgi:hypothetical protein
VKPVCALVVLEKCTVFDRLKYLVASIMSGMNPPDVEVAIVDAVDGSISERLNMRVRLFPTMLGFLGDELRLGWEGLTLETTSDDVRACLEQIAALAGEDHRETA